MKGEVCFKGMARYPPLYTTDEELQIFWYIRAQELKVAIKARSDIENKGNFSIPLSSYKLILTLYLICQF